MPHGRQADAVVQIGGKLYALEVKSGGAVRGAGQGWKDNLINKGKGVLFGRKAKDAGIDGNVLAGTFVIRVP